MGHAHMPAAELKSFGKPDEVREFPKGRVELINIGFGRAAAALSRLIGHRVQLEVPEITMCPIEQMGEYLRPLVKNEVASVHQIFSGSVEGDALLILDQNSAAILKELLTNEPALPLEIDRSAREVLTEIKADDSFKRIPVVILTTSQAEEDILKAYHLNANCYIPKPVDLERFLTVVKTIEDFWLTIVKLPPE